MCKLDVELNQNIGARPVLDMPLKPSNRHTRPRWVTKVRQIRQNHLLIELILSDIHIVFDSFEQDLNERITCIRLVGNVVV